jgi:hypothetical protein
LFSAPAVVLLSVATTAPDAFRPFRRNEAEPLLRHVLMIKHQLHDDSDSGIENFLALVLERK